MSECDYLFNLILLIGSKGTGQATLRNNHMSGAFNSDLKSTIGVDFSSKSVTLKNGIKVRLGFSDIAENGHFNRINRMFYNHAPAAIILYDLTLKDSFTNLNKWCQEIRKSTKNIQILLVGNKCDLPEQREVSADYVSQLKEQYKLSETMEISAKTGEHVEEMFLELVNLLMNNCKTKL